MSRQAIRLTKEMRENVARAAASLAGATEREKTHGTMRAFKEALVFAWIGDASAHEAYKAAPPHFFAKRTWEVFSGERRAGTLTLDDLPPLPAVPAFDLSVDAQTTWPSVEIRAGSHLWPLFAQARAAQRAIAAARNEVFNDVRNALTAYRLVKDARQAIPELGDLLPPDYQDEVVARVAAGRVPANPLEPLREMLRAYGMTTSAEEAKGQ